MPPATEAPPRAPESPLDPPVGEKPPRARPIEYSAELMEEILDRLSQGVTLSDICRADGMPSRVTVVRWVNADRDLSIRYARAREEGIDARFDNIGTLARDTSMETDRARLVVDTEKFTVAKLAPYRYGDKIDVTIHKGPEALPDGEFNQALDAKMRPRLEKLFAVHPNPTINQIIGAFQVPELPKPKGEP